MFHKRLHLSADDVTHIVLGLSPFPSISFNCCPSATTIIVMFGKKMIHKSLHLSADDATHIDPFGYDKP